MNRSLTVVIVLLCSLSVSQGEQWLPETSLVDGTGTSGFYNSIAVTPDGTPHIAYFSDDSDDLRYAVLSNDTWNTETVDTTDDMGRHCSIAVDSSGAPHISYYRTYQQAIPIIGTVTLGELKYAKWGGSAWSIATPDAPSAQSDREPGQYTSIALNGGGQPRIAYHEGYAADLRYVENGGSGGTPATVATSGTVGKGASLALDSFGNPHIACVSDSNILYARWTNSAWTVETVPINNLSSERIGLALDAANQPHIAYVSDIGVQYVAHLVRAGFSK